MSQFVLAALSALTNMAADSKGLATHAGYLVRSEPGWGSYVPGGPTNWQDTSVFLANLEWEEYTPPEECSREECRYFRAISPMDGIVGAVFFVGWWPRQVKVVDGHKPSPETGNPRGLRLTAATPNGAEVITDMLSLVIGPASPDDNTQIPWTWHPGPVTAPAAGDMIPVLEMLERGETPGPRDLAKISKAGVHFV